MVLLLQVGNAFNSLGYGFTLPFEIIYLHQFRGHRRNTSLWSMLDRCRPSRS